MNAVSAHSGQNELPVVLSVPNKGVCKLLQSGRNGCGISLFKGFSFVTIKP